MTEIERLEKVQEQWMELVKVLDEVATPWMRDDGEGGLPATIRRMAEDAQRAEVCEQQARIHAQEARTANSTIGEIYQLCSGATGERGNWHGAEPVRQVIAERDQLRAENERLREMEAILARTRYRTDKEDRGTIWIRATFEEWSRLVDLIRDPEEESQEVHRD